MFALGMTERVFEHIQLFVDTIFVYHQGIIVTLNSFKDVKFDI